MIGAARIIQGVGGTIDFVLSAAAFQGTEALAATVSTGSTAAAPLSLTPAWTPGQAAGAYQLCYATYTAGQSAALAPGFYVVAVTLADSTAGLAYALLEVVAAPGQQPAYDWLVQPAEVMGLVPDLSDAGKLVALPRICGAASHSIRRYCARHFTRRVVTKEFAPSYRGEVMLGEIPVNQVLRVATGRRDALSLAGPKAAQVANAYFATTGDRGIGQVTTGLVLYSLASGVPTTTTIPFATNQTLAGLAAAIRAVPGWTADAGSYGAWAATELVGGEAARGTLGPDAAWLGVYAEDAAAEYLDQDTGLLRLGRPGASSLDSPSWGPDWVTWRNAAAFPSRVKVTYDAGYTTLPDPVVAAAVATVQAILASYAADNAILSESADGYSYTLRANIEAIPLVARQMLAPYRIAHA